MCEKAVKKKEQVWNTVGGARGRTLDPKRKRRSRVGGRNRRGGEGHVIGKRVEWGTNLELLLVEKE